MKRKIFWIILVVSVLAVSGAVGLSSQYRIPVLMYHHVEANPNHRVDTVTPENFAEQMKYLADHRYHLVTAGEFAKAVIEGRELPRKTVVITFDDGYEDVYLHAFPVLKKYRLPSTLFMISDFFGREGEFLTVEEVKEMMASGMEIGCHTRHHVYLPGIREPALLTDEIASCKTILEERLGTTIDIFSYPVGGFNQAIVQEVQKAGYVAAFTTNRADFKKADRWALRGLK